MHTTSIYPTPYDKVDLDVITLYRIRYASDSIIGLSDHTPSIYTSIGAMALGAKVIEKHVTLDRDLDGPDQDSSILPDELAQIVEASKALQYHASYKKNCYPEELMKLNKWRNV